MPFDVKHVEAQISLDLISAENLPRVAWDALEAGFDGPAIRRLAALDFPTYFQVAEVLPAAMREMGIFRISEEHAAIRLAKAVALRLLSSDKGLMGDLSELESLWVRTDYSESLTKLGTLYDDVWIAQSSGQSDADIRDLVRSTLSQFLELHSEA